MFDLTPDDPRSIGPHRLLARLGAGGMGKVYLARSPTGDLIALKLVRDHLAHDAEFRDRFAREVRTAARVRGPLTPAVVDFDTESDVPWLATEYVPAPTLKEAVKKYGPLSSDSLPVLASGLARALAAVHRAGIMHRDLKPGNVMLSPRGPQVIDFGLARAVEGTVLTRTGQTFGTPAYASPEQVAGDVITPASDVFSLAGMVVFAASGEPPFGGGRKSGVLNRVTKGEPELSAIGEGPLRDLLVRCLSKDPAERPDVAGVLTALADVPMPETEHQWLPPDVGEEVRRRRDRRKVTIARGRWRRPVLVAGAAALALLLVGDGGDVFSAPSEGSDDPATIGAGGAAAPDSAFVDAALDADLRSADEVTFSSDGERVYVSGPLTFSIWDLRAREAVDQLDPRPRDADVIPEGLIAAAHDDRVEVLEGGSETLVATLTPGGSGLVLESKVALSPDGDRVAAIGYGDDGNVIHIWDVETGEIVRDVPLEYHFSRLEYTADGEHLVALIYGYDGSGPLAIAVWETDTGEWEHYFEGDPDMTFGLHPTDPSLMALAEDGLVRMIDVRTGEEIRLMDAPGEGHAQVNSLVFSPDGERLYGGVEADILDAPLGTVWDVATGEAVHAGDVPLPGPLAVHPDGEVVAAVDTSGDEEHVLVLDTGDLNIIDELS